jgi:predicted LPLAT superfamily acyltransferase
MAVNNPIPRPRNPGPSWGYRFLLQAEHHLPRVLFRPAFMLGTWVAVASMPVQRRHSRAFLALVLGRSPGYIEVWRHFFALAEMLLLKLRIAGGTAHTCRLVPANAAQFEALLASGRPALFGSFHFGRSDLLGFLLGARGRRVKMIRLRVDNSDDTRLLGEQFGGAVSFLWVNDPGTLLFELKTALENGESLAMKCDRLEPSSKAGPFRFLGCDRLFPFTIYHLSLIFDRPVSFCVGVPGTSEDETVVHASPVFHPDASSSREANLGKARAHFQGVLGQLETLVRQHPTLWFNYLPLNPEAPSRPRLAVAACPTSPPTGS